MPENLTWKPDAQGRNTRWDGGLIRYAANGRQSFIIERMVNGQRYMVSTRTHALTQALKQLARFEADPMRYTRKEEVEDALFLTQELVDEFIEYSREVRKNSANWISTQRIYLTAWAEQLQSRELRKLSLKDDVDPALDAWKSGRPHRIKVLKAFMGWLRKVKRLLRSSEDATIDLPVPQIRPEQARRMKAVAPEHFEKAMTELKKLDRDVHDGMLVLGATGCHFSELQRFIRSGSIEPVPKGTRDAAGVLMFQHKSGVPHRVRVTRRALEAARRLKKRGIGWDNHTFGGRLKEACAAAGVAQFHPGELRHSVATWAVNAGSDPTSVAAFLGHRSVATLKKFYSTHASPKRVHTLVE